MTGSQEMELVSPPADGITTVAFCPSASSASLLLSSSWDTNLSLHDADKNFLLTSIPHSSPVLDTCWSQSANLAFSATLDSSVHCVDLSASALSSLPSPHTGGVRCIAYHGSSQLLITAGWDGLVCTFDPRSSQLVSSCQLSSHIYSLAVEHHTDTFAVAGSGQSISLFDIRTPSRPTSQRSSTLSHQSRCIRIRPTSTNTGASGSPSNCFALSSIRGRVAIDYFSAPPAPVQPFGFKAHTTAAALPAGKAVAHPVHAMAFHTVHSDCLATGGGDCSVAVWDVDKRKRLCVWTGAAGAGRAGLAVSSLSWSCDGRRLAMACGYGWEYGEAGVKAGTRDGIWVRRVEDSELKRA